MSWQLAIVIVIELAALGFLAHKLWPRGRRPRVLQKPDVPTQSLLRKRKSQGS